MKAVTWHGKRDVRVEQVPDPTIVDATDVIVRVTSSGICGSDLHLYALMGPFLDEGEILRVPLGNTLPIKVPEGPPDDRFVFLSDVLPTAWQGVEYAGIPDGGSVTVLGLGPIGDMACRIAQHRGYRVIGVDLVPERLE